LRCWCRDRSARYPSDLDDSQWRVLEREGRAVIAELTQASGRPLAMSYGRCATRCYVVKNGIEWRARRGPYWRAAIITPGGRTIVAVRELTRGVRVRQELVKFSAVTGTKTAILNNLRIYGNYEQVLWTSGSGHVLVIAGARPGASAGIVRGDRYTAIPWSAGILAAPGNPPRYQPASMRSRKEFTRAVNSFGCSAKHRWDASSMITSSDPAMRRCISAR
jgi:transposase